MKLVTRRQWGARSRSIPTNITPQRGGVTGHFVGASRINDSHSACAGRVRGIQNFHIDVRGWADVAYTLLICQHGYVYVGRGINRRTAANGTNSGNQNWYAICFLIGGSQEPTEEALQAGRDAVAYLRRSGGAGSGVNGHRDHTNTSCPGNPLYGLIRAGQLIPGSSGSPPSSAVRSPRSVQEAVNALGYTPPLKVDGAYGPLTEAGVEWLQARVGAQVDGVWGPETERLYLAYLEDDMSERHWYSYFSPRDGDRQVIPPGEIRAIRYASSSNANVAPDNRYVTVAFADREVLSASVGVRLETEDGGEPGPYYLFYGRVPNDTAADDVSKGTRFLGTETSEKRCRMGFLTETFSSSSDDARLRTYIHNYGDQPLYLSGAQFESRQRSK